MFEVEWRPILGVDGAWAVVKPIERVAPKNYSNNEEVPKVAISTTEGGFLFHPGEDDKGVTVRGREYAFQFVIKYEDDAWREDFLIHVLTCYRRDGGRWVDCSAPPALTAVMKRIIEEIAKDTEEITVVSRGLALERELVDHYTEINRLQEELAGRLQALARTYAQRDNLVKENNRR